MKITRAELDELVAKGAVVGPPVKLPAMETGIAQQTATVSPKLLRVLIPLELPSMANARLHHFKRARIVKHQREVVGFSLRSLSLPPLPATVILTRIAPRKLDDDNLANATKAVRDQIAEEYGVDDGSELYAWIPQQRKGVAAVEITIISKETV